MKSLALILLVASPILAAPQSSECDERCTREYKPVCGANGKTYNTACELRVENCLNNAKVPVARRGPCEEAVETEQAREADECERVCRRDFKPVCGSDGKTYGNECEFEKANCRARSTLEIVKNTACDVEPRTDEDPCSKDCNRDFKQVCGSNGKTYNNECLLEEDQCRSENQITLAKQGPCNGNSFVTNEDPCDKKCNRDFKQVCGSNGKTYNNKCLLEEDQCRSDNQISLLKEGPCSSSSIVFESPGSGEEEDPCARKCGREFKPLCGSDGQTYNNECLLEVAKCSKNTDIQIIRRSPCDE